jgi:2-succinyl-6-hydroxy-2,4-cyclohexadiene-1-carboxylate synthase
MTIRTITVDSATGPIALSITEAGEGGRPLLLIHGFTGAKEDFADFLEPLAEAGWHVVAPDHRGHGDSTKPEDPAAYSFDLLATDMLGLLDALGWPSAVALGHSMGGMVLQIAAVRAPDRFTAIILMDTSHRALRADPNVIELGAALALTEGMAAVRDVQTAFAGTRQPSEARAHATIPGYGAFGDRKLLAAAPAMYSAMLRVITGVDPSVDRLDDLRSIKVPALVIVGEEDAPFRKASARMAEAIPDARLVVIPDAAHSPQFENPEAWWKALSGFLDEVAAG